MKFENGLVVLMGFLVSVVVVLIASNPNEVPSWTQVDQINQQAIQAKETEDTRKLESYKSLMQEKLKRIASDTLEIPITRIYLEEDFNFPFIESSEIQSFDPSDEYPTCNITPKIPIHFQNIREAEMFQIFSQKYSGYEIELIVQDERRHKSMVHYGFVAFSDDGNHTASIHFHGNSCTDEITDKDKYHLSCRDNIKDEMMNTSNYDDIIVSIQLEEFCTIPLDPWRQSIYEYGKTLSAKMKQLHKKAENMDKNYDSVMAHISEMERLGLLSNLIGSIVIGNMDNPVTHEKISEYNDRFGSLPDELLELIEKRK